jgi:hypothetical protein
MDPRLPAPRLIALLLTLAVLLGHAPDARAAIDLAWTEGQAFALPLGVPLSTASVTSGSLPPGLSLTTIATIPNISGTPTTAGDYSFTIQVTPPIGSPVSTSYDMTIAEPPAIDQSGLPGARVGSPYSATVTVTGGTEPLVFAPVTGLPPGLQFSVTTLEITGTPTTAGNYGFTVQGTDLALATVSATLSIEVTEGPKLTATGNEVWTVLRPGFEFRVTATEGTAPYDWDDPTGIPPGLDWSREGSVLTVSGTPTEIGLTRFSVTVRDALLTETTLGTDLVVNDAPTIDDAPLPQATFGRQYNTKVAVRGGAPEFSFRLVAATAGWLDLDGATGTLFGIPDATGTESVTVEAVDASGSTAESEFSLVVNQAPQLLDLLLPIAVRDEEFGTDLPATGGTAPLVFELASGVLPEGLRIEDSRMVGTPTEPGSTDFELAVRDAWGATATRQHRLIVGRAVPVNSKLPDLQIRGQTNEAFVCDVIAGTKLSYSLKVLVGADLLTVRMQTVGGQPLLYLPFLKTKKNGVRIKKKPVSKTGRVALVLGAEGGGTIQVFGKVSGRPAKSFREQVSWGIGDVEIPFAALEGAKITIQATAKGQGVPGADLVSLTGPDGSEIDVGPFTRAKRGGFRISKLVAAAGGDHTLRVRPEPGGTQGGTLKVAVRIRSGKQYVFGVD